MRHTADPALDAHSAEQAAPPAREDDPGAALVAQVAAVDAATIRDLVVQARAIPTDARERGPSQSRPWVDAESIRAYHALAAAIRQHNSCVEEVCQRAARFAAAAQARAGLDESRLLVEALWALTTSRVRVAEVYRRQRGWLPLRVGDLALVYLREVICAPIDLPGAADQRAAALQPARWLKDDLASWMAAEMQAELSAPARRATASSPSRADAAARPRPAR
ncbi:MAG: hypothetical protein IPO81_10900 [Kouleothrix sp.]|nr:hypothetical protein [Kouleothrix sp.]